MSHILAPAEAQAHAENALGRPLTAEEGDRFRESIKAAARAAEVRRQTVIMDAPLIGDGQGRTVDDAERDAGALSVVLCLVALVTPVLLILAGARLAGWLS